MSVLNGSIAIAPGSPTPSAGARSKIGFHVLQPSCVSQTPPHAVPMYMMLELFGLTAMAVTWPLALMLMAVVFALVFALLPFVVVQVLANRRMKKLHQQLPDVLMILATSLRSGHSFLQRCKRRRHGARSGRRRSGRLRRTRSC